MKYLLTILLIIGTMTMPKNIKHGKQNAINMPKRFLTSEGRLPPASLRISYPGVDYSKYTYKQLVQIEKNRKQQIDRKIQPKNPFTPKVKRG